MSAERRIYKTMIRACDAGTVPDGVYGPDSVRWATPEETKRFGLHHTPLVHLDAAGNVDCYFTETEAVVVVSKQ